MFICGTFGVCQVAPNGKEPACSFSVLHIGLSLPQETQMYRTDFWTLWEKVRVGCFERTALKHIYYPGWNRSPAQMHETSARAWCTGRPRGIRWRGRWEEGCGTHVNPWLIHVNVWQKPLQYCKVISLQLIKINGKKNKEPACYCRKLKRWGFNSWVRKIP